jgi:hypothetical protein
VYRAVAAYPSCTYIEAMTKHVSIRLAEDLHSWLVARAAREHRSVNGHIEHLLEQDRAMDSMRDKEFRPRDGDPRNLESDNLELRERPS